MSDTRPPLVYIVQEIATHLSGWVVGTPKTPHYVQMRCETTGTVVGVARPWNYKKLEFSVCYPSHISGSSSSARSWGLTQRKDLPDSDTMAVTATREPEAIARDFRRRLEGNARLLYAAAEKRATDALLLHDTLSDSLDRLVDGLGEPNRNLRGEHRARLGGQYHHKGTGEYRRWDGTVEMSSYRPDEVDLRLRNIPTEYADQIMCLLKALNSTQEG